MKKILLLLILTASVVAERKELKTLVRSSEAIKKEMYLCTKHLIATRKRLIKLLHYGPDLTPMEIEAQDTEFSTSYLEFKKLTDLLINNVLELEKAEKLENEDKGELE